MYCEVLTIWTVLRIERGNGETLSPVAPEFFANCLHPVRSVYLHTPPQDVFFVWQRTGEGDHASRLFICTVLSVQTVLIKLE
jgi:hypothetical protein